MLFWRQESSIMSHLFSLSPSAVLCPHISSSQTPRLGSANSSGDFSLLSPVPLCLLRWTFQTTRKMMMKYGKERESWEENGLFPFLSHFLLLLCSHLRLLRCPFCSSSLLPRKGTADPKGRGRGTTPLHLFINHKPFDANI